MKKKDDEVTRADFPEITDWSWWDEIVNDTRKKIDEQLEQYKSLLYKKEDIEKNQVRIYLYDRDGELYKWFDSIEQTACYFNTANSTITRYSKNEGIIKGFLLSREKLRNDIAFALYKNAMHIGNTFNPDSTNSKNKTVFVYNQNGKVVGMFDSVKTFFASKNSKSNSRWILDERILDERLLSYKRYSEDEAKEKYKNSKQITKRLN